MRKLIFILTIIMVLACVPFILGFLINYPVFTARTYQLANTFIFMLLCWLEGWLYIFFGIGVTSVVITLYDYLKTDK